MRLFFKAALVLAMTLAILVPLLLIREVIHDRQGYRAQAVASIAQTVGGAQTVAGPVLVVPFVEVAQVPVAGGDGVTRLVPQRRDRQWTFFPTRLVAKGSLTPGTRHRGLHEVRTYQWQGTLDTVYDVRIPADVPGTTRLLGKPFLSLGLRDVRGLRGTPTWTLDGRAVQPAQGSGIDGVSGVHVPLSELQAGQTLALHSVLQLAVSGTEAFALLPLGQQNDIRLTSGWKHPSFNGIASQNRIDGRGFEARWQVNALATDAQARWKAREWIAPLGTAGASPTGIADFAQVSLVDPVNIYVQADRATKYGILFVLLTFVGFFMFELIKQVRVHPIQYGLVGLAIAIFFLLLVSLSEHVRFGVAYVAAAVACIGLIGFYLSAVLRSTLHGLGFAAMLGTLYACLYGLLVSEDNALVMGAGLLFAILAAVMIATRKVDWFALSGPTAGAPSGLGGRIGAMLR